MEKFIMAGGCALRISDSGIKQCGEGAPTLMLLHGYMESLEVWDAVMPYLKPHFRVVAIDIPGHGISQVVGEVHTMEFLADTVQAVLRELSIERCVMVGHSMGGYVALAFLRKYPQLLSGLVMLHSTPNPDSEEKQGQRLREIEIVQAGKKDMLAQIAPMGGFAAENRNRFADRIEELADQITLTDDDGIIALLRGMSQREDMNDILVQSIVPQLFIFGRGDEYITAEVAQKMIDTHPAAKVAWLEHSGHMSLIEEPEQCAEAIVEFVSEL